MLFVFEVGIYDYPENLDLGLSRIRCPLIAKGAELDLYAFRVKCIIAVFSVPKVALFLPS
jgi:hypothetical protein